MQWFLSLRIADLRVAFKIFSLFSLFGRDVYFTIMWAFWIMKQFKLFDTVLTIKIKNKI